MGIQLKIDSDEAYGLAAELASLRRESSELVNSMSGLDFGIAAIDPGQSHLAQLASGLKKRVIASRLRRGNPEPQAPAFWRVALDCRVANAPRNDEMRLCDRAAVYAGMAWIAWRAKLTYRKGHNLARLNFGDCFSYSLA